MSCPLTSADPPPRSPTATVVGQDDDVQAAVQVDLLQAVHQLAHHPVHALQRHLQLRNKEAQVEPPVEVLSVKGSFKSVAV